MATSLGTSKAADMIRTGQNEGIKTYHVYDMANRVIELWEAPLHADDNTKCLVTRIKYVDATSRRILATKETLENWNEAYDYDVL